VILACVQARMGSTRLPGKSLALLAGKPLLEHVCNRVNAAKYVNYVCVATTTNPADDAIEKLCNELGVDCYRGSEDDVLARTYWCAERYPLAEVVVRITADDWAKDPALIDMAIEQFLSMWGRADENGVLKMMIGGKWVEVDAPHYLHLGRATWALGADVEVFSKQALTWAHQRANDAYSREHVTPWMEENLPWTVVEDKLERRNVGSRWTIDDEADLERARAVYDVMYPKNNLFSYQDLVDEGIY
jgi:spore coat polysaccharide biosynthesis protein SpsF